VSKHSHEVFASDVLYVTLAIAMARGLSGRIVIEVDPATKHDLYVALARRGLTLKAWFLHETGQYLEAEGQRRDAPVSPPVHGTESKEAEK